MYGETKSRPSRLSTWRCERPRRRAWAADAGIGGAATGLPGALLLRRGDLVGDLLHVRGRRAAGHEHLLERRGDDLLGGDVVLEELAAGRVALLHRLDRDVQVDVLEVRPD